MRQAAQDSALLVDAPAHLATAAWTVHDPIFSDLLVDAFSRRPLSLERIRAPRLNRRHRQLVHELSERLDPGRVDSGRWPRHRAPANTTWSHRPGRVADRSESGLAIRRPTPQSSVWIVNATANPIVVTTPTSLPPCS
jgi:hypothetical protein